ncbi:MAG: hypothetical protein ACYSWO_08740 [Planctomycetota bacterium]|jgi:hypothetical protein
MIHKLYLAGPITGCSFAGCTDWRKGVADALAGYNVECLDPMRGKDYLSGETNIGNEYDTVLSCSRGIMTRDRFDCTRCDLLLVNFLGATKVSIGTVMEIAWADLCRIPIVIVSEDCNVHNHAMLSEACGFRVESLGSAIDVVKAVLNLKGE